MDNKGRKNFNKLMMAALSSSVFLFSSQVLVSAETLNENLDNGTEIIDADNNENQDSNSFEDTTETSVSEDSEAIGEEGDTSSNESSEQDGTENSTDNGEESSEANGEEAGNPEEGKQVSDEADQNDQANEEQPGQDESEQVEEPTQADPNSSKASYQDLDLEIAPLIPEDAEFEQREGVNRIAGENRFKNSVEISKAGWDTADTVLLTNGNIFQDALTGTPLSATFDAPLLLTHGDRLVDPVAEEIKRLQAKNVIILGGELSFTTEAENAVKALGVNVGRIGGKNRYHQAGIVAEEVMNKKEELLGQKVKHDIFIVNGDEFADALSVAPFAASERMPIFLTRSDRLNRNITGVLDRVSKVYLVGGELSISSEIEDYFIDEGLSVHRFAGRNRYDVNRQVLDHFGVSSDEIFVANGEIFSDGLPVASLAAKEQKALLLIKDEHVVNVKEQLKYISDQEGKDDFTLFGGTLTISERTEEWLETPLDTVYYEVVVDETNLNGQPFYIQEEIVRLSQAPFGSASEEVEDSQLSDNLEDAVVSVFDVVKLSDGSIHAKIQFDNNDEYWINIDDISDERFLENVTWYGQLQPNSVVGWGCAGASSAMLLSSKGHTFNSRQLEEIMRNIPKRTATQPYGQDGNIDTGKGFTQVVQPEALVPYLQNNYDQGVFHMSEDTSTEAVVRQILSGYPVLYYGYTWSNTSKSESRNHVKVIVGYKDGNFTVYDPVYNSANAKRGYWGASKYDKGAVFTMTEKEFNDEVSTGRQFVSIG